MRKISNQLKRLVFLCVIWNTAQAAPPVDASSIQRDIDKLNSPKLPPVTAPRDDAQAIPTPDNQVNIKVTAFDFIGEQILSEALLQAEVLPFIGQTLDYNGLNLVAKKISELYRKKGWLAKVYLPPQDIQNGLVTIEINEAKLGEVKTNTDKNLRLNPNLATKMLTRAQQKGAHLSNSALERAMLLINDTPGFNAQATLSSGVQTSETDVTLTLADKPIFNAIISADNYGSRQIGKARVTGQMSFNNLTGWGDALNLSVLKSRGLEYVSGDFSLPLGYSGTRMNVGGAVSNYEVVGNGLSDLESKGDSYSLRTGLTHPLVRSRYANLLLNSTAELLGTQDNVLGFEIADKQYRNLSVGLKGDSSDTFGLGGVFWGGISVTAGILDLNNRDDFAADQLSARTDGSYNKLNFYLGRQQILADNLTAKALLSGQLTDGNLGGFEKFSLGGPSGLSGFTVGEAAADQGWMLNLEGRYAFNSKLSASLLADAGGVCQHKNTWAAWNAGNPQLKNCYQLASVGFGLGFAHQLFDARLSYGRQITGNAGLTANNEDAEGENSRHQLWLQLNTRF